MELFQKKKVFSQFLFAFSNLDSILNIFRENMALKTDVFLKLRTPRNVVR